MSERYEIRPIGMVRGGRLDQGDDRWGGIVSTIALDRERFGPETLAGLGDFSHVDVIFICHMVDERAISTRARHPGNRFDWPLVGIFAEREADRPNRLGLTTCELVGVAGVDVRVRGLDATAGTPIVDLKPHITEGLPERTRQPAWISERLRNHW
ncbi:MAG: TrmO family methyltransferase [Actinomycetota bacterium]|nr:TrmO family methyltransferase [Actinomycetota bacterium]